MITERSPKRVDLRREYDASARLVKMPTPDSAHLTPCVETLAAAREDGDRAGVNAACKQMLDLFAAFYDVPAPEIKVLGPRPHRTHEGVLAYELFGDYEVKSAKIRLWTRTAINKQWTSSGVMLSTLCHEFIHHLDIARLGFSRSYHTTGFFERTHTLYQAALGQPHYPLAWHPPDSDGSRKINWPATRRRRPRS
jgi:hypothetical protein